MVVGRIIGHKIWPIVSSGKNSARAVDLKIDKVAKLTAVGGKLLEQLDCAQRTQTSAKASNFNQKWSGIRIRVSALNRIRIDCRCMPNRFHNVLDSLCCQHQSFRRVSWKSATDCVRNANKSPKIPYSAMVRKVEKWFGICIRDRIIVKT